MTNHWKLTSTRPYLALSIVGGAKNFKMEGRKRQVFKEGLITAARSELNNLESIGLQKKYEHKFAMENFSL